MCEYYELYLKKSIIERENLMRQYKDVPFTSFSDFCEWFSEHDEEKYDYICEWMNKENSIIGLREVDHCNVDIVKKGDYVTRFSCVLITFNIVELFEDVLVDCENNIISCTVDGVWGKL